MSDGSPSMASMIACTKPGRILSIWTEFINKLSVRLSLVNAGGCDSEAVGGFALEATDCT